MDTLKKLIKNQDFYVFLAPLAGVSDYPFRKICQEQGADLTYVEMLSATALTYASQRTREMCARFADEPFLGVQLTGRTPEETAQAIKILEEFNFDTVDLNMGCPVQKVVKSGCGSAIIRDPRRVLETVKQARDATQKPLSAKIRIGWDRASINTDFVAKAVEDGGADWLTVHGRCRNDDYAQPVSLEEIASAKRKIKIPVVGNGNIFTCHDVDFMAAKTNVDGVMVSRGALGNPWIFREIKAKKPIPVSVDEWRTVVLNHLSLQNKTYKNSPAGAVCMRKHLLWYAKGWPGKKTFRESINVLDDLNHAPKIIDEFCEDLVSKNIMFRSEVSSLETTERFSSWDPKFEMDRTLDRGVGCDTL